MYKKATWNWKAPLTGAVVGGGTVYAIARLIGLSRRESLLTAPVGALAGAAVGDTYGHRRNIQNQLQALNNKVSQLPG